jgi:hypothetical protein
LLITIFSRQIGQEDDLVTQFFKQLVCIKGLQSQLDKTNGNFFKFFIELFSMLGNQQIIQILISSSFSSSLDVSNRISFEVYKKI